MLTCRAGAANDHKPTCEREQSANCDAIGYVHNSRMHTTTSTNSQWTLRYRSMGKRGYSYSGRRGAGVVTRQPGNLHSQRHTTEYCYDADARKGDMMNIDFPFHFDSRGRTAVANDDRHILQMIEQLLFTDAGERVNRPDFGSGLQQLIFAPNSPELAAALQFTLKATLQRWLGDLIEVRALDVTGEESTLNIFIQYEVRRNNEVQTAQLVRTM